MCRSCSNRCAAEEVNQQLELECPICNGTGCEQCDDGFFKVNECPNKFIADIIPTVSVIDFFHQGILPTTGGLLDQAAWIVEAARVLKHEDAIAKAEAINGG